MKKKIIFLFKKSFFILFLIIIIGFCLRIFNLWDNVIFAYDQARDGTRILDIISLKHFKLVGPETDIQGVFNGPLLYYLLAPIYFIFRANPNYAALFFVLINTSGMILVYFLSKILFNNKNIGYIAAFLWAISYEQANFARFISNASPMGISSALFFLGIAIYLFKKKDIGLQISIIGLAASVHFNFYLVYLVVFYPIFYFIFSPKIKIRNIFWSFILLIILLFPFVIAEMKWKFLMVRSLFDYLNHQSGFSLITNNLSRYMQSFSETIYYSFFSFNLFLGLLIFVGLFMLLAHNKEYKNGFKFLSIWIFSTLPLFSYTSGVLSGVVINSSIFIPLTIFFALSIYELLRIRRNLTIGLFLLLIIIISNIQLFFKDEFRDIKLFALQPLLLKDEKKIIDYTYNNSNGKSFSICSISNPLFINTLWSYLYNWYGKEKYGYLPYWAGQKQDININYLAYDYNHVTKRFLIIEPQGGISPLLKRAMIYLEDRTSYLQQEVKIGEIIVQKRELLKNNKKFYDSQHLSKSEVQKVESDWSKEVRFTCFLDYR